MYYSNLNLKKLSKANFEKMIMKLRRKYANLKKKKNQSVKVLRLHEIPGGIEYQMGKLSLKRPAEKSTANTLATQMGKLRLNKSKVSSPIQEKRKNVSGSKCVSDEFKSARQRCVTKRRLKQQRPLTKKEQEHQWRLEVYSYYHPKKQWGR